MTSSPWCISSSDRESPGKVNLPIWIKSLLTPNDHNIGFSLPRTMVKLSSDLTIRISFFLRAAAPEIGHRPNILRFPCPQLESTTSALVSSASTAFSSSWSYFTWGAIAQISVPVSSEKLYGWCMLPRGISTMSPFLAVHILPISGLSIVSSPSVII